MTFSLGTPSDLMSSTQAMAAAPAPLQTSLKVLRSRPVRCNALISPAVAMMAVPCWSSWKTGMSISSRSRCSMMKQSGALMSSRLMPPKDGPEIAHRVDELVDVPGVDLEVDRIDVGEALEEHRLAFHHRLGGQRAKIAKTQDGRAVGNDGHQIALGGVVIGGGGILRDLADWYGNARAIGQRQVALGGHRLCGRDFQFARLALLVELQRLFVGDRGAPARPLLGTHG